MTYRTVDVEGLVTYRQNGYSVPWRYIGSVLPVRVTETEVIIYDPQVVEIARHALLRARPPASGACRRNTGPPRTRGGVRRNWERFAELGDGGRFLEGLLRASVTARTRPNGSWRSRDLPELT